MTDDQQATRDLADASRYIRTYAKDMAAAGGAGQGSDAVSPAKSRPEPEPAPAPAPEPPPQSDVLNKITEERDSILSRLKSRVASQPLPVVEPIRPTAAVFTAAPEPIPSIPPITKTPEPIPQPIPVPPPPIAPPPIPPPLPIRKPEPEVASRLHTYKTDFADEIDNRGASTFSVLAAQANAKPASIPSARKDKRILPVVLSSLLLIGLGAGGVYAAYWFITRPPSIPVVLLAPSLVFVDERVELEGPDYFNDLADLAEEPLVEGNAVLAYITYSTTSPKGLIKTPLQGGELIDSMNLGAPDILLRNIDPSSSVGVISAGGEVRPFFVMRVNSYERTYAGMLSWESSMQQDLKPFYPAVGTTASVVPFMDMSATSTSTTSPSASPVSSAPILPEPEFFSVFRDEIIQNHDVRVLRDKQGNSLLMYGYRGKDMLIIARNEAAYLELIRRLTAAGN